MLYFAQESGRAGQQPTIRANSVVYFQSVDSTVVASDQGMHEYCRNPNSRCLREMISQQFNQNVQASPNATVATQNQSHLHDCCSVCVSKCQCGECNVTLRMPVKEDVEDTDDSDDESQETEREKWRELNDEEKELIRNALYGMRWIYGGKNLSDQVINEIMKDIDYIEDCDDLMAYYIFDSNLASHCWYAMSQEACLFS